MRTVEVNNSVQVSDTKGLSVVLSKLDYPRLDPLEKINFWLDEIWLNVYLNGSSDDLEEFEKVLKKVAPFIEEEENFYAHIQNDYGISDVLYVFKDNTFHKYKEYCCYPNYGFYPLNSDTIIRSIKSNKKLEEKISAALAKNNDKIDYKRKFVALVNLIDEKYKSLRGENEYIYFDILDDIATEAYKLELESDYYGK